MRVLEVSYSVWKQVVQAHPAWTVYQFALGSNKRDIWAGVDTWVYASHILPAQLSDYQTNFEENENVTIVVVAQPDDALALIKGTSLVVGSQTDFDGVPLAARKVPSGSEFITATHNYCDKTTWYHDSARVTGETLSDSGDGLTFTSANSNWIDLEHGRVFDEDDISEDGPDHGYLVKVYVDSVEKTMRSPFATSGGDYEVDYEAGEVTFFSAPSGTVTADYSYENGSTWVLEPEAGKYLDIELAEVQFTSDVIWNDSIDFEVWAYNPEDLPNKICYDRLSYKTLRNLIDEAIGSYPVIPQIGGDRGSLGNVHGFPFHYATLRRLNSSVGMELRVLLRNDTAFGGASATGTFYTTSHEE